MKQKLSTLVAALSITTICSTATAERITAYNAPNYVQHYYEFDSNENSQRYWWCGHAALKIVDAFVNNRDKPETVRGTNPPLNLSAIHETFKKNNRYASSSYDATIVHGVCGTGWCASLQDIHYAAKNTYGMPNAKITRINKKRADGSKNYVGLFQEIRTVIKDRKSPAVVMGQMSVTDNTGHAWVIIGYNTDGVYNPDVDPRNVYVFVRDSAFPRVYEEMDKWHRIEDFYTMIANLNTSYSDYGVIRFK